MLTHCCRNIDETVGGSAVARGVARQARARASLIAGAVVACAACAAPAPVRMPVHGPSAPGAGSAPAPPPVVTSARPAGDGRTSSALALASPMPPTPAHPFARYLVTGARSGVRAPVLVRLPPEYFAPGQEARRFPVIETFHGSPGHEEQWLGKLRLGHVLDEAVAARRMSPAIIVSPSMNYPDDRTDRECVDGGPGRPALETWAAVDVPDWVARSFRARTDRDAWATIGLSAGGWCAAMASMLHPDRYRAAAVLSGYFRPQFPAVPADPVTPDQARRYDLLALARTAPPPVAVWLVTSPNDPESFVSSHALEKARPPLAVTSVVLAHQDHSWTVWAHLLPDVLAWLVRVAPGFAPGARAGT